MMMTNLKPEVKNANGVNTFQVFTSEKNDSQLGGVAKTKNVYWHPNGSKKKSERRNAWECRFLEIQEVPSGNNEHAIK